MCGASVAAAVAPTGAADEDDSPNDERKLDNVYYCRNNYHRTGRPRIDSDQGEVAGLGRRKNPFEKTRVFSNGFYGFFQNNFEKTHGSRVFSKI